MSETADIKRLREIKAELYESLDLMTSIAAGLIVLARGADATQKSTADFIDREYPSIRRAMALLAKARGEA